MSGAKKGAVVEDFDGRIKNIEAKLKGVSPATDKKPKDLLRAIGKHGYLYGTFLSVNHYYLTQ